MFALNEVHDDHHVEEVGHAGEGFFDILTDPAHLAVEGTTEFFFLALGAVITRIQLKRRDKKHGHAQHAH